MNIACILMGGRNYLIKDSYGKEWKFEDHPYCGPVVLKKDGDPAINQPPGNSLFWKAVNCWAAQGKKSKDGVCIYEEIKERKPILKHIGGRHWEIVGYE